MTFTFIKGAMLAGAMIAPQAHTLPDTTRNAQIEPPAVVQVAPAQDRGH